MDKKQALEIFKLLSALESWSFSADKPVPDYLFDRMDNSAVERSDQILLDDSGAEDVRD